MLKPVNYVKTDIVNDMMRCLEKKTANLVSSPNFLNKTDTTKRLSVLEALELKAKLNIASLSDAYQKTGGTISDVLPSKEIGTNWFKKI